MALSPREDKTTAKDNKIETSDQWRKNTKFALSHNDTVLILHLGRGTATGKSVDGLKVATVHPTTGRSENSRNRAPVEIEDGTKI